MVVLRFNFTIRDDMEPLRLVRAIRHAAQHAQTLMPVDRRRHNLYPESAMELNLTPELQAKLSRLAAEHGRDTQALAQEAIERFVDYDEWFLCEVEKGLAAADRGEFVEQEDIGKLINSRYPG